MSEAWLGPSYQITSQLNVVNPGGAAQVAHRDYHLGFQSAAAIERFPVHVQRLSPVLTLQGAIAHCDMPIETGPTLYLPFSQSYLPGYMATARPEFRDYFDKHHVQLPLAKGDAVFFNPALFHAAGTNRSKDVRRIANLLQVSSAFGRAMESVDRLKMSLKLYPALKDLLSDQAITAAEADNAIAASAEGYSFPTNLDRDPPKGGMAPKTQQDLMRQALKENWPPDVFVDEAAGAGQAEADLRRPPRRGGGKPPGSAADAIVLADSRVQAALELGEQLQDLWVREGQKLRHDHAGHALARIKPEIGVEQPGPGHAAGAASAGPLLRVDVPGQAPFLHHPGKQVGVLRGCRLRRLQCLDVQDRRYDSAASARSSRA